MAISAIANAVRSAMCDAAVDLLDTGTGTGGAVIKIYNSGETTLLVQIECAEPAFGAASNGVATLDTDTDGISGTGETGVDDTAAVAHFCDNDGTVLWKCTVTATGGGGDITLNTTTIQDGATVTITSGTFTMPAS